METVVDTEVATMYAVNAMTACSLLLTQRYVTTETLHNPTVSALLSHALCLDYHSHSVLRCRGGGEGGSGEKHFEGHCTKCVLLLVVTA
jgi:hypothetical protein